MGFLAALGVQFAAAQAGVQDPRLSWPAHHGSASVLSLNEDPDALCALLAADPSSPGARWIVERTYLKVEKNGPKVFGGCYVPIGVYRAWVHEAMARADEGSLRYLAALFCAAPGDPIEEKKAPTAAQMEEAGAAWDGALDVATHASPFDFSSRNMQFLDQVRLIGQDVNATSVHAELWRGEFASASGGRRMGWDPWSGRPGAMGGGDASPIAPALEWFAFRALGQFAFVPHRREPRMTACEGRRKEGVFTWPLWDRPLSVESVRTLLDLSLSESWSTAERVARGVRSVYSAALSKSADGYSGTFAPTAAVLPRAESVRRTSRRTSGNRGT